MESILYFYTHVANVSHAHLHYLVGCLLISFDWHIISLLSQSHTARVPNSSAF